MDEKDINIKKINEEEIDLVEIVQKLWKNRRFILKVTIAFTILGLIVAISTPNIYTASCTMVPQSGEKKAGGSLSGLAAMAGINLGSLSSGEVLSPTVYPKIMTNINFQKELIYSKYHFKKVELPITLFDYYTDEKYKKFSLISIIKKYTIGLPRVVLNKIKGEQMDINQPDSMLLQSLTIKEKEVIKMINSNLTLTVNNKDGYVSISANMQEPILAAELAQRGQELLQKYITAFKIEKVSKNLQFVETSYEESKRNFELKQIELARYRDANKDLASSMAKTQEEKLTSEYTLLLGIYSELAKQKEQAKISVTETTPILTIVEPVVIPNEKSKPSRVMILSIFTFLGLIISAGIVFTLPYLEKNFIPNTKKNRYLPKIV